MSFPTEGDNFLQQQAILMESPLLSSFLAPGLSDLANQPSETERRIAASKEIGNKLETVVGENYDDIICVPLLFVIDESEIFNATAPKERAVEAIDFMIKVGFELKNSANIDCVMPLIMQRFINTMIANEEIKSNKVKARDAERIIKGLLHTGAYYSFLYEDIMPTTIREFVESLDIDDFTGSL